MYSDWSADLLDLENGGENQYYHEDQYEMNREYEMIQGIDLKKKLTVASRQINASVFVRTIS